MHFSTAALLSLAMIGCGQVESLTGKKETKASGPAAVATPVPISASHSMLVADASALPECNAAGEGWLVYLKAEKKFQACQSAAWADVDVTVATNKVVSSITCSGAVPVNSSTSFAYELTTMSSGDAFVSATVKNEYGGNSNSHFFAKGSIGAVKGAIAVIYDSGVVYAGANFYLSLDRATNIVTISTRDRAASITGGPWALPASACTVNAY